ncbi:cyclopropane-fatty-acyl-phospholipid synthase family protein [Alphaproteobacteria bacterium]|nr:cyclopropane-fatty-acyl-phospholipid synthase family protein [Alphaproteobacteria bacterium]
MTGFLERKKCDLLLSIFSSLQFGSLTVTLPSGVRHEFKGRQSGPAADLNLRSMNAISRILSNGKMGFCEAVMDGEADSVSMPTLIELAVLHDQTLSKEMSAGFCRRIGLQLYHRFRRNSKTGAAKNIAYHYDLGNEFYSAWLDQTMTYSSAVFDSDEDDLSTAQINKYRHLADLADIQPGDQVLEIGCGWGGFARYAIEERGAHVTGITISQAQHEYTRKRLADAGLSERVDIQLIDYRDLRGSFDKIVSIEMFEAVGQAYWQTYFQSIAGLLKKGGRAAVQSITIEEDAFEEYRREPDFIQRYIFPGGMLPSMPRLDEPVSAAGLQLVTANGFGLHYARTLAEWRTRFRAAWPTLARDNFDSRFQRMWELYLSYCEGGFRAGMIDVKQMLFTHK